MLPSVTRAGEGGPIRDAREIRATTRWAIAVLAGLLVSACGPREQAAITGARAPGPTAAELAYHAPPQALALSRGAAGLVLAGTARPGSRVRLGEPSGAAQFVVADASGAWRIALPAPPDVRLFGLSMTEDGRTVQAEGYLALAPPGVAAQLRSGAGAWVLGRSAVSVASSAPKILAVDFDRASGGRPVAVVVSGLGRPGGMVTVLDGGAPRGRAPVGPHGRFSLALDQPLAPGDHRLEAVEGAASDAAQVVLAPAAPLTGGPFRAQPVAGGWRIDWLTPGGGEQSTIVLDPAR